MAHFSNEENIEFNSNMKNELFSKSSHLRRNCLRNIGYKLTPSSKFFGSDDLITHMVKWYFYDSDSRVREAAFDVFCYWLKVKYIIPDYLEIYDCAIEGLNDPHDNVVLKCLELLVALSDMYPDVKITVEFKEEPIKLKDAIFGLVASGIQHNSFIVRRNSMILLRQLELISENWLMETIEKTVMVDKIVRPSVLERQQGNTTLKTPEEALKRGCANGTLVSGLEDEYYEIRIETIKTVTQFCRKNSKFALACQDLLVDMLTDDIEAVRAAALEAIRVAISGKIRIDQLDIVLGVLCEKSSAVRRSVYELLGGASLSSSAALVKLLTKLLHALQAIPGDHEAVWKCAARIGRAHPRFVDLCITPILQLHPYLTAQQPSLEDHCYITVLLLIVNAAKSLRSLTYNLPQHVLEAFQFVTQFRSEFILTQDTEMTIYVTDVPAKRPKLDGLNEYHCKMRENFENYCSLIHKMIQIPLCSFDKKKMKCEDCLLKMEEVRKRDDKMEFEISMKELKEISSEFDQMSKVWSEQVGRSVWMKDLVGIIAFCIQQQGNLRHILSAQRLIHKMILAYSNVPDNDIGILKRLLQNLERKINEFNNKDDIISINVCISMLRNLSCFSKSSLFSPFEISGKVLSPNESDFGKQVWKFTTGLSVNLNLKAEFTGLQVEEGMNQSIRVLTPIVVILECLDGRVIEWHPPVADWSRTKPSTSSDEAIFDHRPGISSSLSSTTYLDTCVSFSSTEWSDASKISISLGIALPAFCSKSQKPIIITKPVSVMIFPINTICAH